MLCWFDMTCRGWRARRLLHAACVVTYLSRAFSAEVRMAYQYWIYQKMVYHWCEKI